MGLWLNDNGIIDDGVEPFGSCDCMTLGNSNHVARAGSPALLLVAAALSGTPSQAADAIVSGSFTSDGVKRTYAAYAPPRAGLRPLVILLHGTGWTGRAMVRRWKGLAKREGIVVAGPDATDRSGWQPPQDGPALFRDLVEELKPQRVDPRRIYPFGYSAGAIFALYMAPIQSEYFAAAAAHAGAYTGEADLGFLGTTRRKIPLLLSAGTKDALFPPSVVNATVGRLKRDGFPVTTSLLAGEGHSYRSSGEINERAWRFLQRHRLATDPVFVPVRLTPP
jgi:poly(3-hydroxybutyrate) depolymerase